MITCTIEAHENRDVATIDIPGAYLHTETDEQVVMVLRGKLAELMVAIDPAKYKPFLTFDSKGTPLLYVRMLKALYGMLRSALLFYLKLVKDLKAYGFTLNPYDACVANKVINGHQMTVAWHVDDLKVSHLQPIEIIKFAKYLGEIYGPKVKVHRGKIHDFLGMDLDYREKGKVKISMIRYLKKILTSFPKKITGSAPSPAADHLFQVRDPQETKYLTPQEAIDFHHTVYQLLFMSNRARRDIHTPISFLTTKVKKPDRDDWGKLVRVLNYLKSTKHMKLTLSADSLSIIKWWINASHQIHDDCRGHTRSMMTLGRGSVLSYSRKHKINVKSTTEGELVSTADELGTVLWSKYFTEAQGYFIKENKIYQDNKPTILLETNGRASSSKRTKHIRARYFFIRDKVADGDVQIEYCPTKEMWADVLNKPKQGSEFRRFRSILMNVPMAYDDEAEAAVTLPELKNNKDENGGATGREAQRLATSAIAQKMMNTRVAPCIHHRSVLQDMTNYRQNRLNNRQNYRDSKRGIVPSRISKE